MVAGKQGRQSAQQQGQGNKGADKGHERQHDDRPVLVQLVVVHIFSSLLFLLLFLLLLGGRIEYSPLDVVGGDEEPVLREGDRAVHGDVGDRPGRRVNDVDALDVLGLGSRSLWFRFLHFGFRFLCCFHWLGYFGFRRLLWRRSTDLDGGRRILGGFDQLDGGIALFLEDLGGLGSSSQGFLGLGLDDFLGKNHFFLSFFLSFFGVSLFLFFSFFFFFFFLFFFFFFFFFFLKKKKKKKKKKKRDKTN